MSYPNTSFTHSLVIPAGGIRPINTGGCFFRIVRSNVPLQIQRSGAAYQPYEQGDAEELPDGEEFSRLEIKNSTAADAYVQIYVGFGRREQSRQTVMEQPTRATGSGVVMLAAGGTITLTGVPPLGCIARKSIMVTNFDLANPLMVTTPEGAAIGACLPRTAWRENISGAVVVSNPSGNGISCIVGEVWYDSIA